MSRVTIVSASANTRSVASSSPASQVGLARLSLLSLLVVPDQRRIGIERLAGVDDRRQRVVLHVDQLQRIARRVLVGGDHERDLLTLEADLVTGQHRLGVIGDRRHPGQPQRLQVLGGDHRRDLGVGERLRGVDREDPGVGVRAPQHGPVNHPGQPDVIQVGALAADEARVLLALESTEADRPLGTRAGEVLDDRHAHASCLVAASCSAAQRTAATMFL